MPHYIDTICHMQRPITCQAALASVCKTAVKELATDLLELLYNINDSYFARTALYTKVSCKTLPVSLAEDCFVRTVGKKRGSEQNGM